MTALARFALVALALALPVLVWDAVAAGAIMRDIEALGRSNKAHRSRALSSLREAEARAIPYLIESFAARDERRDVESVAHARVMTCLYGMSRARVVPALIAALGHENGGVQHNAGMALALIGADAVPALVRMLREDPRPERRASAGWALSMMGGDAAPAIDALTQALRDPDKHVRGTARYALHQLGSADADLSEAAATVRRRAERAR